VAHCDISGSEDCRGFVEAAAKHDTTLLDAIVELTCERDAYRLLAKQAIHHCHALYEELRLLRARHGRLRRDMAFQLFGRQGRL
jgi:hypothetical protein